MEMLNEDWFGEEVWPIDDPRVPPEVRAHGARFRKPAAWAIELDPGEFTLYAADSEMLDACWLD